MFPKTIIEALRGALRTRLTGDSATDCFLSKEDVAVLVETTELTKLQIKYFVEHFRSRTPLKDRLAKLDSEGSEEVMPQMPLPTQFWPIVYRP